MLQYHQERLQGEPEEEQELQHQLHGPSRQDGPCYCGGERKPGDDKCPSGRKNTSYRKPNEFLSEELNHL